MHNRRSFIRHTGLLAGTSILATTLQQSTFGAFHKKMAASDRIHVAAIGINGMGWADLLSSMKQPGVEVVMLCDTDKILSLKFLTILKIPTTNLLVCVLILCKAENKNRFTILSMM